MIAPIPQHGDHKSFAALAEFFGITVDLRIGGGENPEERAEEIRAALVFREEPGAAGAPVAAADQSRPRESALHDNGGSRFTGSINCLRASFVDPVPL